MQPGEGKQGEGTAHREEGEGSIRERGPEVAQVLRLRRIHEERSLQRRDAVVHPMAMRPSNASACSALPRGTEWLCGK